MLAYASILIISLVVALVVLFFYKIVSDSSRSIYRSKYPIALTGSSPDQLKNQSAHKTAAGVSAPPGGQRRVLPPKIDQIYPAMPNETFDWGWQGSGKQFHEHGQHHGKGAGQLSADNTGHCSLYNVGIAEPTADSNQQTGWPHREEKTEPAGKAYKVTRKVVTKDEDLETVSKPWGW